MNIKEKQASELLPVINESGEVVRLERRDTIHAQGLPHMAVHALLFNERGEALLQKRSEHKDTFAGYWDLSVGGHVGPDENFEVALQREMLEELGIATACEFLRDVGPAEWTGWELVREYIGRCDQPVNPDPLEISSVEFIDPKKLIQEIESARRQVTPVLRSCLEFYLQQEEPAE